MTLTSTDFHNVSKLPWCLTWLVMLLVCLVSVILTVLCGLSISRLYGASSSWIWVSGVCLKLVNQLTGASANHYHLQLQLAPYKRAFDKTNRTAKKRQSFHRLRYNNQSSQPRQTNNIRFLLTNQVVEMSTSLLGTNLNLPGFDDT